VLDGRCQPEGVKEREHLGGDGVDNAVDDADDGDREATRNLRSGKHHFFFLGIGYRIAGDMLSAAGMGAGAGVAHEMLFDLSHVAAAHAIRKRATSITVVVQSVVVRAAWALLGDLA
jgi:hypothetical protein